MKTIALCFAAALTNLLAPLAAAQDYPSRPITMVNPYAAGGPADLLARLLADGMSIELGQRVIVENKPGAATAIGAAMVAKAPPDGHTIFIAGSSAHVVSPAIMPNVGYDGIKDFAFVSMVANVPNVLVVRPGLDVKAPQDLIALAKAKPGTLTYASVGNGSQPHMAGELFKLMTATDLVHVPYKGAAPATLDLLGGSVDLGFLNLPALLPHIKAGKVQALAVTTAKRAEQVPNLPTLQELGLAGFDVTTWYGVSAPAGTPQPIVEKLHAVIAKVLSSPETKAKLTEQGAEVFLLGPREFEAYLKEDADRMTKVIRAANIKND